MDEPRDFWSPAFRGHMPWHMERLTIRELDMLIDWSKKAVF